MNCDYLIDPFSAKRRPTRVVQVGDVAIGGDNPIRIQSMTNTDSMDTLATVGQIERLAAAGCEIARVTAPSIRDAENLREIKAELARRGVRIPLVADIHFTPNAAMIAAQHVEKVRVNPGNYADKKKFEVREYSDAEYEAEVERVAERFRPLVRRCKRNGVAMRIGTNHGSLSDRVMNRYGDSPLGMVESALEFLDVCEDEAYSDVVFSMKASNTHVAIQAYRLLAARLRERAPGASYPFHLGVTEAGDSKDGRIKSAIGIGALLDDGIGDTIRVSLTEDPVREVPAAQLIARRSELAWSRDRERAPIPLDPRHRPDPYVHTRRSTRRVALQDQGVGQDEPVRVELDLGPLGDEPAAVARGVSDALRGLRDVQCEGILVGADDEEDCSALGPLMQALAESGIAIPLAARIPAALLAAGVAPPKSLARVVVPISARSSFATLAAAAQSVAAAGAPLEWSLAAERAQLPELVGRALEAARDVASAGLLFSLSGTGPAHAAVHGVRLLAALLASHGAGDLPIVLRHARSSAGDEAALIDAAAELGPPLVDGIGDAISLAGFHDLGEAVDLAYRILQGARLRTTRTEYISCPSCGRTLFDLEQTTARIKSLTEHLSGVKIAIMGCIVNGPGEMADADFGYVGSGPGVVTLYVGKQIVARSVPEADAADRLVALIREQGRWQDGAA